MLRMYLLQPLSCYMRINLRGRNIGMPQQQLHHAQIRAVIDEVGGKRVSQGVRRNWFVHAGFDCVALDHVPEHLPRQLFGADFAIAMHEYTQRLMFVVLEDQRFDDVMFIDAER